MNLANFYLWFKTFHIIAVICWMSGLLYLPRIYVYHTKVKTGSEADKLFQIMEYRLLKFIMNPAMISSYVFGLLNAYIYGFSVLGIWFHIKFSMVILLSAYHGFLAHIRRSFAQGTNIYSEKFYRIINELPALAMIIAVAMVVIKPFD